MKRVVLTAIAAAALAGAATLGSPRAEAMTLPGITGAPAQTVSLNCFATLTRSRRRISLPTSFAKSSNADIARCLQVHFDPGMMSSRLLGAFIGVHRRSPCEVVMSPFIR